MMGRHIAVAASALDEDLFLAFLRETAEIQLFRYFASNQEELWVDRFAPFGPNDDTYFIWNKSYAWKPKFKSTETGDQVYIENNTHGPVLKFRRTHLSSFLTKDLDVGAHGGIYWAKYNRQKGFLAWFDSIVRWLRRRGHNLCPRSSSAVYCLPDAFRLWRERIEPLASDSQSLVKQRAFRENG